MNCSSCVSSGLVGAITAEKGHMMKLEEDFVFRPLPAVKKTIHYPLGGTNPLGPLAALVGTWYGKGFNTIWRPNNTPGQDRFLELNLTTETITFDVISGAIPNRGLLQQDINMFGITYLQQVADANLQAGLHIEPGIWAVVPETTDPTEGPTVVRMASIPHGTTVLAQGTAFEVAGGPVISDTNIKPFGIGNPEGAFSFPEQDLSTPTPFRSDPQQIVGVTQSMVDNPNSVLKDAIAGQTIQKTTVLQVATKPTDVLVGGGTANTAFLVGSANGPNAVAAEMSAIFWIETVYGSQDLQLQYTQTVLLNFNGVSWPHVTVATLRKATPVEVSVLKVDPDIPKSEVTSTGGPGSTTLGAPLRTCPFGQNK